LLAKPVSKREVLKNYWGDTEAVKRGPDYSIRLAFINKIEQKR